MSSTLAWLKLGFRLLLAEELSKKIRMKIYFENCKINASTLCSSNSINEKQEL